MVTDYALRTTLGANYTVNDNNTIGAYWQSPMSFQFSNAVRVAGNYQDLHIQQPMTVGLGWANRTLLDGRLLIATDVYFKDWQNAALWQDVLVNQWVFAIGTQYTQGNYKFRLGYSYNTNPINHNVGNNLDGFRSARPMFNCSRPVARRSSTRIGSLPVSAAQAFWSRISTWTCLPVECSRPPIVLGPTRRPRWPYITSAWGSPGSSANAALGPASKAFSARTAGAYKSSPAV